MSGLTQVSIISMLLGIGILQIIMFTIVTKMYDLLFQMGKVISAMAGVLSVPDDDEEEA